MNIKVNWLASKCTAARNGSHCCQLANEVLEPRNFMAAHQFVPMEFPASQFVTNHRQQSDLNLQSAAYRQISTVDENSIKTVGLHPQGHAIITTMLTMQLPPSAVDAIIENVVDSDTALGFATFPNGETEGVLWITPEIVVRLGDSVPIAGVQFGDQSVLVALESSSGMRVIEFDRNGEITHSLNLGSDTYTEVLTTSEGLLLWGSAEGGSSLAHVDEDFSVSTVELQLPASATFALPVGYYRYSAGWEYVGTASDDQGRTRVVLWDQQGNIRESVLLDGYSASKAVGRVILVESDSGQAVVFRDEAIARRFNTEVNQPIAIAELALLQGRGLTQIAIPDIWEVNGELYLGIVALGANSQLKHGMIVSAEHSLPSPWQNSRIPADVNRSGSVTPIDALIVINEMNRTGPRKLTAVDLTDLALQDVNGDGVLTPIDALIAINYLNRQFGNRNEGESRSIAEERLISGYPGGELAETLEQMRRRGVKLLRS